MRAASRFLPAAFCFVFGLNVWATAADTKEPLPWDDIESLPPAAAVLLQDKKFAEAADELDKLAAAAGAPRDRLLFARGRALHFAGRYDDAANVFAAVEREFTKSPWARRARFARAVSLAKKGDFASAELIYRAEAEHLLSHERKQELADIYLDFARRYATPRTERSPPDQPPPDYAKAVEFFNQALDLGPKPDLRPEIELQLAHCFRLSDNFEEAANRYAAFVRDRPDDVRQPEARYRLGECRQKQGRAADARRVWQDLAALWPGDKRPPGPDQAEFVALAVYGIASTYGLPTPTGDDDLAAGIAALEAFLKQFPDHRLADDARVQLVTSRIHRGRFAEAVAAAEDFLNEPRRAKTKQAAEVRNLLGRALQRQGKFTEALAAWRSFLVEHPSHSAWNEVQQQIIETEYLIGAEAFRKKDYAAARAQWNEFLARYPLDPRSPQILLQFGRAEFLNKKYEAAIDEWRRLISKYPGTEQASQALFAVASVLEENLGRPLEALEEYRKLTWGSQVAAAQARVNRLVAKQFTIASERVFRTDEPARIALHSRNLPSVNVRVYTIDLETYFRKMHLARGVESLDLALIDPNRTFTFAVPDYAEYKPRESRIELAGLDGEQASNKPGVVVATVASKTHEATTLVVRSDLDVIVKSSRDEVFVFAENLRTGKPWPGARILVSDGAEIVAEGTTGKDGTFRGTYKQLENCNDVRVFAVADGHTASNVVSLGGVGVGQGLEERGFVYTERAGYRPGETVHVRAALRGVVDDRYVAVANKKYRLEVYDPRTRVVHSTEATTGDFGTLHGYFQLADTAVPGDYRVQVCDVDGRCFAGSFRVENYSLEPVRLSIDLPRKVYFRGEEVAGTITAAFYYGTPLAGREVSYSFGNGETITGTTDAQGKLAFKLPTRDYREEQQLRLVAQLPERNLAAAADVFLAVRGYSIGLTIPRDVVTVGESFTVEVKTTSADGKPTGEKLSLQVVEQITVDGEPGEKIAATHEVTTDAKSGLGRLTLALDKGARYLLRVAGRDRFDNPVTTSKQLFVSGDDDVVRLRILADRHNYKLGDEAKVRVHWREAPALALVTLQGAKILEYRLVELKTGDNELAIAVKDHLAPNFHLEVNVMTDVRDEPKAADSARRRLRLHTTTSEFMVDRDLRITLEMKPKSGDGKTAQPGDSVEVTVKALDAQGKPAAAEIGLALVDAQNADRFGAAAADWLRAFAGVYRRPAMRTTASIDFAYRPQTTAINARLLSEEERLEIAAQEQELRETLEKAGAGTLTFSGAMGNLGGMVPAAAAPVPAAKPQSASAAGPVPATPALQFRGDTNGRADLGLAVEQQADKKGEAAKRNWAAAENSFGAILFDAPTELEIARFGVDANSLSRKSLSAYAARGRSELTVITDGVQSNVHLGEKLAERDSDELLRSLRADNALIMAVAEQQETAYWNPSLRTDASGSAVVRLTLPQRSTQWKWIAKGITTESATGEAVDELTVKKQLFGELSVPAVATLGDAIEVSVVVHDERELPAGAPAGDIVVVLSVKAGDKTTELRKTIPADKSKLYELSFPLSAEAAAAAQGSPEAIELTLSVAAGDNRDVVRRSVPLRPNGYSVIAAAGGSVTSDTTVWLEPPAGLQAESAKLEITVGAAVDRSLLEIVLGGRMWCEAHLRYASPLETSTSDLLAALALEKLVNATRDRGTAEAAELAVRVRSTIGYLAGAQADDGGWTWTGNHGTSDRRASARVVWALSAAKAAGYKVPDDAYARALNYLQSQLAGVADDDLEGKAVVLHALAEAGRGDFSVANRLYRSRSTMSAAGAAYLALALARMDHGPMAADLLATIKPADLDVPAAADKAVQTTQSGGAEIRALFGLALIKAGVDSPRLKESVDKLLDSRIGRRWSPERATGPAAMVLAEYFAKHRPGGEPYKLDVVVNNHEVKTIDVDPAAPPQTIAVPAADLTAGKQRVQFRMTGRGHLAYQCVLGGFVPTEKLTSTVKSWHLRRRFEPGVRELDGRELPRGFGIVAGSHNEFVNPLTQLPIGRRGRVQLQLWRTWPSGLAPQSDDQLDYLVVREPLAAGTAIVEQSLRGGFERYELLPGEIVFYVGNRRGIENITFDVVGATAGEYRAPPTMVFDAYKPERFVIDDEPTKLAVLPRGKQSVDAYRWTPDELFELGKRYFAKRDWAAARLHLTELLAGWTLEAAPYQESLRMLLDVHLQLGPPAEIVRYFELVKEKSPDLEVSFDKILKVGSAYHELGEYERSYLVFRATVESSFLSDAAVPGFLESQGEFLRSVGVMRRLIGEYPPEPYVAAAEYALAQQVYGYAPSVAADAKLRARKLTRLNLIAAARRMLDEFLTAHPDDPAADQAAFAEANALLELEQYDAAVARCEAFARRYPESDFLDSYWYITGYAHFAAGRPDEALETCRKVAELKRVDKTTGRTTESRNKERAIYILGQVYHSLGKAADAVREYLRVENQIPDAKKAAEYFTRREIKLPEVLTIRPGEPTEVTLKFRNVPKCDVRAYRIDLMKFSLLRQNLEAITQINLAGIRPLHETTIELGDGKDYRDRERKIALPIKDEGAYLVVCRGDNLHASGFVLVSPLVLDVQEDPVSGQVRTTVKNAVQEKYAPGVHVKVIGSRDHEFKAGETDLRGVFSAEPVSGRSTIIAQSNDNRYAFYRGDKDLLPAREAQIELKQQVEQRGMQPKDAQQGTTQAGKDFLLQELNIGNGLLQRQQIDNLRDNYFNNRSKGVKVKAAY